MIGLAAIIVYGIVDYLVFDAFLDKLTWKLLWSHFYEPASSAQTDDYMAIKDFEKNPSPDNYSYRPPGLTTE